MKADWVPSVPLLVMDGFSGTLLCRCHHAAPRRCVCPLFAAAAAASEPQSITRRTGEETQKRSMIVRDDSGRSIEVTLWGPLVNNPGDQIEQVRKPRCVWKGVSRRAVKARGLSHINANLT
jgi:hypothetical protein